MQMDTSSFGAANASCVYGVLQLLFDELNWYNGVLFIEQSPNMVALSCVNSRYVLPPFHYIRCFSFVKQMYLDIF
jgi:hypothetical protein